MDTVLFFISATRLSCRERLDGILSVAHRQPWHVQVVERAYNRIDVKAELDFWQPIGVIAECGSRADELNRESFGGLPTVYFERDPNLGQGDTMLMLDSTAVGQLAARELTEAGFEHFAFIPFRDATIYWSVEREQAFCSALARQGHQVHRFTTSGRESPTARRTALRKFLTALPRPCAIFVANDLTAVETIDVATASGLDVPNDLSVLSVDNDPILCEKTEPTISSINPDYFSAGRLAAETLVRLIHGKTRRGGELIKFGPVALVRRESVRAPGSSASRPIDARVRLAIRQLLPHGVSVKKIAEELGLARRSMEIKFRKATGQTILEAIHDAIFEQASTMARSGRLSASAVPDFLGVSHDTLNRIFLRRTGLTLSAWQRQAHEPTPGPVPTPLRQSPSVCVL